MEANHHNHQDATGDGRLRDTSPSSPTEHRFWHNVWQVIKTIQARLRFIAILVAIGVLIGYWDTLSNYYEKWTRPAAGTETASADFEYFCPMHPFIVRET